MSVDLGGGEIRLTRQQSLVHGSKVKKQTIAAVWTIAVMTYWVRPLCFYMERIWLAGVVRAKIVMRIFC